MKIVIALLIIALVMNPSKVSAHVFVNDETKTRGAILHISPDDDPIAGEKAVLFFDVQESLISENSYVNLFITNQTTPEEVKTKQDGTLNTAEYVFPNTGEYLITYKVSVDNEIYEFNYTQRVNRGDVGRSFANNTNELAEIFAITSGVGLLVVLIVAFNRRKDISIKSKL